MKKPSKKKASLTLNDIAKAIHRLDSQTNNANERQALVMLLRFAADGLEKRCEILPRKRNAKTK
jgi:hypothetical protein